MTAVAPAAPPFAASLVATLFAAVLVNDEIDAALQLPARVQVDFTRDELAACFRLSRQLWRDGFDRAALVRFATILMRRGDLDAEDRVRFKHVRAKFKHVRYAHALYGTAAGYPPHINRITVVMGHVQDACRHGRRATARTRGALLRVLASRRATRWLHKEAERQRVVAPPIFRARLASDMAVLDTLLAAPRVTGPVFHDARKVVGRQVAFWDALRTLGPQEDRVHMSRWLSAINGAMGAMHDALVERRVADAASYHAPLMLPAELRERIGMLTARVGASLAGQA